MDERFDHGEQLPPDLEEVAALLREERHQATPVELDSIKLRAMRQATDPGRAPRRSAQRLRRQALTIAIAVGMVVAGGGAAVAMSGHFVKHHHTASAAWFQYKPPCPSHNPKGTVSKRGKARGSWKHEPCKPPPRPPCSSKGQISKAHAAGARPCTPPPCSFGKAHAAGGNSCTPHKPGGTTPTTETTTPVTTQAPVVPNVQSSPGSSVQPTHTVQKHKAKKHKAKKHLKRHSAKRHSAKKHSAKKH